MTESSSFLSLEFAIDGVGELASRWQQVGGWKCVVEMEWLWAQSVELVTARVGEDVAGPG